MPVWQGAAALLHFGQELSLFQVWRVQHDSPAGLEVLEQSLPTFARKRVHREDEPGVTLLLREPRASQ